LIGTLEEVVVARAIPGIARADEAAIAHDASQLRLLVSGED
jgi:hypothetical protein